MIHTVINGPWGTDKLDDGVRINIKAEENTVYSASWTGDAHLQLAKEIVESLPAESRRELIPIITGGIEVPKNFEPGPQG
jgi:hypothetical protein